jgi:hypothetical protein
MLPDWMIDAINKQEQEKREQEEAQRPRLEVPVPEDWRPYPEDKKEESSRGVITFNIWGD